MAKAIRGLCNIASAPKGCVVTIGNFDGVHIGHQALLKKITEKAKDLKTQSAVVIFEPQPYEYFARAKVAPRLTRWREKFSWLMQYGVDAIVTLRFNAQLAGWSPEEFVQRILLEGLQARHVIIGDDFRFGHDRKGDFAYLQSIGEREGFVVEAMPSVSLAGERVSSTEVRKALANKDHEKVLQLLGRPFSLQGRVVYGDQRGRTMGFPTANIYLHRAATPVQGVYVVRMHGVADKPVPGVANVGIRPTIGGTRTLLEVHLFNFAEDIYGYHVNVEFCEKLRDEHRFQNLTLLMEQIGKDTVQAKEFFMRRGEL